MVTSAIYYTIGFFLQMILGLLSGISFVLPDAAKSSISYLVNFIGYFNGWINLGALLDSFVFLLNFIIAFTAYRAILFVVGKIRGTHQVQISHKKA